MVWLKNTIRNVVVKSQSILRPKHAPDDSVEEYFLRPDTRYQ